MANPNSREQLKQYCLRALGAPVIQINVAEEQLEDRIDEAIQMFQVYHYDGTLRTFLKHQITDSDLSNGWIPISDDVQIVKSLFPTRGNTVSQGMWNFEYQMYLNDLAFLGTFSLMADISYYTQMKQYLQLLDLTINGYPQVNFSHAQNRLYIHGDLEDGTLETGQWLVAETYNYINPQTWTSIYNEEWLKLYTTALFKRQWGINLKKFEGMQLPGGITFNGQQMFEEATQEIKELEEDLRLSYELPPDMMIG